jgi:hypothetical protein
MYKKTKRKKKGGEMSLGEAKGLGTLHLPDIPLDELASYMLYL